MDTLIENEFAHTSYDESLSMIYFAWQGENEFMSHEDYKNEVSLCTLEVVRYRPKYVIIDTKKLRYVIVPEIQEWSVTANVPAYKESGVQKMALLITEEIITALSVEQTVEEIDTQQYSDMYAIGYFYNKQDAMDWFNETS